MTESRTGDPAYAAMGKRRRALRRKRGTTLIEMVLYLTLVSVVMTFSLGLLREEQVRRERSSLAAELKQVTSASQAFVAANYENLLNTLLNDTAANDPMIAVRPIAEVVAAGFLPQGFAGTSVPKSFVDTLNYSLVMRAVRRDEVGPSPQTVEKKNTPFVLYTPATPSTPDEFEDRWIDRKPGNDEIDLEVLLVTTSADPCVIVPSAQGPRIASQAETMAAGYITGSEGRGGRPVCPVSVLKDPAWDGDFMATGPFGAWTLRLIPYVNLRISGIPVVQPGRLASLIALQNRPALSEGAAIAGAGDSAFRCADVTPNTPQHLACRQSALMYSGITFQAWDSDGDGSPDERPGLENVHSISLAAPAATASPAQIRNVLSLDCLQPPVTTPPTPPVDTAWNPNELNVNCPQTKLQGLVVSANAEVAGDLILKGNNIEAKFVTSKVMEYTTASPLVVPQPNCHGLTASIGASVVSLEATGGLTEQDILWPTVGSNWAVSLKITNGAVVVTNPIGSKLLVHTWCE